MAARDEIIAHLDELLEIDAFSDYGPNGLQVPGADEVTRVVTGVSAQLELFERAAAAGAQLVLCHHGLFWDFHPRTISAGDEARLQALFDADISLAGYHLPLDAHAELGNNALICAELGLEQAEPFAELQGPQRSASSGARPRASRSPSCDERCAAAFGQEPFVWDAGPETVHSVGIVSGDAPKTRSTARSRSASMPSSPARPPST